MENWKFVTVFSTARDVHLSWPEIRLAPRPTRKVEDPLLPAVPDFLFGLFVDVLHIRRPCPPSDTCRRETPLWQRGLVTPILPTDTDAFLLPANRIFSTRQPFSANVFIPSGHLRRISNLKSRPQKPRHWSWTTPTAAVRRRDVLAVYGLPSTEAV
jgi:hypothetical protein